jgi:hypothetical protein
MHIDEGHGRQKRDVCSAKKSIRPVGGDGSSKEDKHSEDRYGEEDGGDEGYNSRLDNKLGSQVRKRHHE